MPIKSQYPNKCKDCGVSYEVGDEISTNGNKSPNKSGEMKDHWCKHGKNCQGVMQLQGGENPSSGITTFTIGDPAGPPQKHEPTPEEIIKFVKENAEYDTDIIDARYHSAQNAAIALLIQKAGIEKIMDMVGIKHPSRVSFMGEVMRRLS